jgi:predicted nucleic acid-binding protein
MTNLTLDAGALIGVERRRRKTIALLERARSRGTRIFVPAGALAQAWRADPRQHDLHALLSAKDVDVVPLDMKAALAAGGLCAKATTDDVIDASVALCARERGAAVVTSDPDDIRTLAPELVVIAI